MITLKAQIMTAADDKEEISSESSAFAKIKFSWKFPSLQYSE